MKRFLILIQAFLLSFSLHATTRTVTTTSDAGPGSLRAQIAAANPGDIVNFDAALDGSTITLTSGLIILNDGITIQGSGMEQTIISGNNNDLIFLVQQTGTLTIEDLTLRDGRNLWSDGGAIYANSGGGTININDVRFASNYSASDGGAIAIAGSTGAYCEVRRCDFVGNTAAYFGGAIDAGSSGPYATTLGYFYDCTFRDNTSTSGEGAHVGSATSLYNCTLSGGNGDAILSQGMAIAHCTVTGASGDGLKLYTGFTYVSNSIFAENGGLDVNGDGSSSGIISTGYNLIENPDPIFNAAATDITGLDAQLLPLEAVNGSALMVHRLSNCSPALDAANPLSTSTDQLGNLPVLGRDIGAYEWQVEAIEDQQGSNVTNASVLLTWADPCTRSRASSLKLYKNGAVFVTLPATSDSYTDISPPKGFTEYGITAIIDGQETPYAPILAKAQSSENISGKVTNLSFSGVPDVDVCAFNPDPANEHALQVGSGVEIDFDFGNDGTIALWAYKSNWFSFSEMLLGTSDLTSYLTLVTGSLGFYHNGASLSSSQPLSPGWHHIGFTWEEVGGSQAIKLYIDGQEVDAGTATTLTGSKSGYLGSSVSALVAHFSGHIDEYQFWNIAQPSTFFERERFSIPFPTIELKQHYRFEPIQLDGHHVYPNHARGNEVALLEIPASATILAGQGIAVGHCSASNSSGNYQITGLDFENPGAPAITYRTRPITTDRFYDPAFQDVISGSTSNVNFVDTTSFVVQGSVDLAGCDLDSVRIEVSGPVSVSAPYAYTDSLGNWSFAIPVEGNWTFTPTPEPGKYEHHGFTPASRTEAVASDMVNIDFSDTTTTLIEAAFTGSCVVATDATTGEPIRNPFVDAVEWKIQTANACYSETFTNAGGWAARKPALPVNVRIESVTGGDLPATYVTGRLDQFETREQFADLGIVPGSSKVDLDFIYTEQPTLSIDDFGIDRDIALTCGGPTTTVKSLEQLNVYDVTARVEEVYTYSGNETRCPISNIANPDSLGFLLYYTDEMAGKFGNIFIQDALVQDTVETVLINPADSAAFLLGNNVIRYPLFARNIKSAGDFKQKFELGVVVPGDAGFFSEERNLVVEGVQESELVPDLRTPQLPTMILRDPPGGNSFSTLQKDVSNCVEISVGNKLAETDEVYGLVKIGSAGSIGGSAGFGAEISWSADFEIYGQVGGGHEWGASNIDLETRRGCQTWSESISTSDDPLFVGKAADIFIGSAFIMRHGMVDEVQYNDTCMQFEQVRSLVFGEDSTAGEFTFTRMQIEQQVIPDLYMNASLLPPVLDTATGNYVTSQEELDMLNQISVWEQVLQYSDSLSDAAIAGADSKTVVFGGGTSTTRQRGSSSAEIMAIEFDLNYDSSVEAELGAFAAGSGALFGYRHQWNVQKSTDTTTTTDTTVIAGFTFADGDPLDEFDVTYNWDGVYNTPVFRLNGGYSSCPNEAGTNPRDTFLLSLDDSYKYEPYDPTAAFQSVDFTLDVSNISFATFDATRTVCVTVTDNYDNLQMTAFGASDLTTPQCQSIPNGVELPFTMTATKISDVHMYNDLRLIAMAPCQVPTYLTAGVEAIEILAERNFSVEFESTCPSVMLTSPVADWQVNQLNSDLFFELDNIGVGEISEVVLQYRLSNFGPWLNIVTLDTSYIQFFEPGALTYSWDVPLSLADGPYQVRAKVECVGSGAIYTDLFEGEVSFDNSQVISTVPADGGTFTIASGTPAVVFNRDIFCGLAPSATVDASFVADGSSILMADTICAGDELSLIINTAASTPCELENEWVRFRVYDLIDANGNPMDTADWTFYIDRYPDPVLSSTLTNPSTAGATDGMIDLNLSGGAAPYTIQAVAPDGSVLYDGPIAGTTVNIPGLVAGPYTFTINDANCSEFEETITLVDPSGAGCSTAVPPQNPTHTFLPGKVRLSWDPVPESVGCQLQGARTSPAGPSGTNVAVGFERSFYDIPTAPLGAGTSWTWQVRCACSVDPIQATAFSAPNTFTIAAATREAPLPATSVMVYPNPATSFIALNLQGYEDESVSIKVVAMDGRVVISQSEEIGLDWDTLELDISLLESGMYRAVVTSATEAQSVSFLKQD